jgi:NADH pyrophosphatase NudC (nudix superfamily)
VPSLKVRFWDPGHWRFRAEETRTVADQMTHEDARTILRRIANDYDRLAKLADEQLAAQEKQKFCPNSLVTSENAGDRGRSCGSF